MHHIETHGTWREMGRQLGETFRDDIQRAQNLFAPWLVTERETYAPALARLRDLLQEHCPDLLDEALGMAEGADLPPDVGLGYRLFNQVALYVHPGCSVVFVRDTDRGPLLGRNCDLGPQELDLQLCHVRRPEGLPATIETTYVGLAAGWCLNEWGLGMAGASAPATAQGEGGWPGPVLSFRLMHQCRTVAEGRALLAQMRFRGKAANHIIADETGDSALYEFVPGLSPREVPPGQATWQACTNFLLSEEPVTYQNPPYLRNAYARYGRAAHVLSHHGVSSLDGLHRLMSDIAQPSAILPDEPGLITAYSHLMDLRARAMHLWPGHPAMVEAVEVRL